MLSILEDRAAANPDVILSFDFALVHQGLGETDETFRHLNEAIDANMGAVVFIAANALWRKEIGSDPRFDALIKRVDHPMLVKA